MYNSIRHAADKKRFAAVRTPWGNETSKGVLLEMWLKWRFQKITLGFYEARQLLALLVYEFLRAITRVLLA
jgi:hypothetical protein